MENSAEELAKKGILAIPTKKDELSVRVKIDSPELVFEIKKSIQEIRWKIGMNWLLIGKFLYLIKRDNAWKFDGVENFGQWIADNREFIGLGIRAAYYLTEIWENLVMKLGITPDQLADIDRSSAREICKYATPKNVNGLLELARGNTYTGLIQKLKAMARGENIEKVEVIGKCEHRGVVVLYKCPECSLGFYQLPETSCFITDKSGIIDENKAKKIAPNVKVVKDNPENAYAREGKKEIERVTRAIKN